jgi:IS30 family transposase
MPREVRRSLTWDQGSEMARHDEIVHLLSDGVFFAEAGWPWQRGSNENTNGLLRQYFPRGTDLSVYSEEHLAAVAHRLNTRPRKTLRRRTHPPRCSPPAYSHDGPGVATTGRISPADKGSVFTCR